MSYIGSHVQAIYNFIVRLKGRIEAVVENQRVFDLHIQGSGRRVNEDYCLCGDYILYVSCDENRKSIWMLEIIIYGFVDKTVVFRRVYPLPVAVRT